ncbi:MAG: hypothetical protein AB7F64_00645 [Gammaproteobacteria bacterium]
MADEDKDIEIHTDPDAQLPSDEEEAPVPHDPDLEEEYHFTEEPSMEAFTAATTPLASKPPKKGLFSRKSFLFIVAVVIIIIAGYQFLRTFQSAPTEKAPQIAQPKPFQQPQQPSTGNTMPTGLTADQANAIANRFAQTDSQIAALGNQVNDLANNMAAIQTNLNTVSQQLQSLAVAVQEQQAHLAAPKVIYKPKKHHYKPVQAQPKPIYHIEAIIPDRAWLRAADGTSITVTKGSSLYGYGIVRRIDAVKGLVFTSSGAIIRYNGN